ncbi:MAG: alpha-2-macroglobulin family protein [Bdellovibrionaceae bacterium]|nr:alpha-2-macroglobulin family protein [Pseudobdellovibrionaceae bacterium]
MKKAWDLFFQFLVTAFGQFRWTPPVWFSELWKRWLNTKLGIKTTTAIKTAKQNPKKAFKVGGIATAAVVVLGVSAYQIKSYYDNLPKPDYATVTIEGPYGSNYHDNNVYGFKLLFSKSSAPLNMVGKEVTEGLSLSPEVKGTWTWNSDKELVFAPKGVEAFKTDWLVGTEYKVHFSKKVFAPHVLLEDYTYRFTTAKLSIYKNKNEFYIDPKNDKIKKVIFNFGANTPLDPEDIKKRITLTMQPKDDSLLGKTATQLKYKVSFNEYNSEVYIESENIELPNATHIAKIVIDKGVQTRRGGEGLQDSITQTVSIPGLHEALKILDPKIIFARNEKFEPEQVLVFESGIDVKAEALQQSISVELLPQDHIDPATKELVKNYRWGSASEVTSEVRKALTAVEWTLLPGQHPQNSQHSIRLQAPVKRYLLFTVKNGVRGIGGYILKDTFSEVVQVPDYTPELLFMSEGAILTLSGDRKLPVLSRNVRKIKYEVGRLLPGNSNILIARLAEGEKFSKPNFYGELEDSVVERFEEKATVSVTSRSATNYTSIDLNTYIKGGRGFYYIKAFKYRSRDDDSYAAESSCLDDEGCGEGSDEAQMEEYQDGDEDGSYSLSDRRLVMITDLGIIAKTTNTKKTFVYVQNLATGNPVTDATVSVIGLNGISIFETTTDATGRAEVPDLTTFHREKRPIAFVARRGEDIAYLPYRMSERELSYSRFDVGGIYEDTTADAINAMLFSDRELYRPGETANIGILLRSQSGGKQYTLPFKITVTDPRGQLAKVDNITGTMFGITDFQFKTNDSSPTGTYNIELSTAPKAGSKKQSTVVGSVQIRVEEFVPDKLRISAQVEPTKIIGWIPLEKTKFHVSLNNLFGSPAENRKIKPDLVLSPVSPYVAKFKSYNFINPNSNDAQTAKEFLTETKTNTKGLADFEADLTKYKGFYSVRFSAEGFEAEGGRSVSAAAGVYASQLKNLVGFKADGSLTFIKQNSTRQVELVAVNSSFEADNVEVHAELIFNDYVSSLVKQDDGTYKYQSVKKEKSLKTDKLKIPKKGFKIDLPADKPGLFSYVFKDLDGNELNRFDFNIVGESNLTRSLDRNSELQITLSKEDFSAGEEVEINIIAPYAGSGLITLERDTVYAQKWFHTTSNSTNERIKIPEGFTGNGYINITFLRSKDSKEIYMSPLSYGVVPFTVNADKAKTVLSISSPEKVKPGETLEVTYSANKTTSIVLYGVDEGIVSAAKYKLPDPLKHYFKKRALQVSTYQLLDLVLPEFSLLKQSYAPGGDGMGADMLGANLNPFKRKGLPPVVFWSGVISADTAKKTYKYKVPDHFNGSIKIYAVANSERGIGSTSHQAISRADFVISPTPPLFVTPSDEFEVGVLVSNQAEDKTQKPDIQVSVVASKHLKTTSDAQVQINLPQGRELGTSFRFKANAELGEGEITFSATNGTLTSAIKQTLSVRPAMPYITTSLFDIAPTSSVELSNPRTMYEEFSKSNLVVSASPVAISLGLFRYLDNYKYLCTEQLLSMTIPYVFMPESTKTPKDDLSVADRHMTAINILRSRQTENGGFALYGGGATNVSASLYAFLYLVEARDRGLTVPKDLLEQAKVFLNSEIVRGTEKLHEARDYAQSLYLLARLGVVPGNKLNFLREKLIKDYKDKWEDDMVAIWLAGAYALVQKQDVGWDIIKGINLKKDIAPEYEYFYDNNVKNATLIHVVASQFTNQMDSFMNSDTLDLLTKDLKKGNYNTHSAARMIMAFAPYQTYASKKGFPSGLKIFEKIKDQEKPVAFNPKLEILDLSLDPKSQKITLKDSPVTPYFYSLSVSGFDKNLPKEEIKKGLEVDRSISSNKIKLGEELLVSVKVRSVKDKYVPHVVVVDLFPAGFELILDSLEAPGVDYVDKREDRVVVYMSLNSNMTEIKYKLKAVNKGKFVLPPIYSESMYDKGMQYRGLSQQMEIL